MDLASLPSEVGAVGRTIESGVDMNRSGSARMMESVARILLRVDKMSCRMRMPAVGLRSWMVQGKPVHAEQRFV